MGRIHGNVAVTLVVVGAVVAVVPVVAAVVVTATGVVEQGRALSGAVSASTHALGGRVEEPEPGDGGQLPTGMARDGRGTLAVEVAPQRVTEAAGGQGIFAEWRRLGGLHGSTVLAGGLGSRDSRRDPF